MAPNFLTVLVGLGGLEIVLRLVRWVRERQPFFHAWRTASPRVLSLESHPYALYVKRPNNEGLYPSNRLGYAGTRDILSERPPMSCRIYCVGGSTTEAHDPAQGPNSSWPGKLQDVLTAKLPGLTIECINAGTAGYTSAESLAEFLFRGVELKPDLLLVYHNVNDAWTCQMVDGFKSDYSHARCHKPWTVGWVNRLPQLPWCATYQVVRAWLTQRFGKANGLIYWIANPPWKSARAFHPAAVRAFERNLIHLISVAHSWGCRPILIKWECDWAARRLPNYLERHPETTDLYFQYLEANNAVLRRLGTQQPGCDYLEVGPFAPSHFSDTIHFSPAGLDAMAQRVAKGLVPIIQSMVKVKTRAPQRPDAVAAETR